MKYTETWISWRYLFASKKRVWFQIRLIDFLSTLILSYTKRLLTGTLPIIWLLMTYLILILNWSHLYKFDRTKIDWGDRSVSSVRPCWSVVVLAVSYKLLQIWKSWLNFDWINRPLWLLSMTAGPHFSVRWRCCEQELYWGGQFSKYETETRWLTGS